MLSLFHVWKLYSHAPKQEICERKLACRQSRATVLSYGLQPSVRIQLRSSEKDYEVVDADMRMAK